MSHDQDANQVFNPPADFAKNAHVKSMADYERMYDRSISDPESFWADIARENFHWHKPWTKVRDYDYENDISIKWFVGGQTNVCYNCVDRHLEKRGDQPAIIWEGNEPGDDGRLTFSELHEQVCKFASVLKTNGVKKGDRVSIYMPMIPELAIAMLACARIGAVHSIVFGGFSADSLADRIVDSTCEILVTADGVYRGKKLIDLKQVSDDAMTAAAKQGVNVRHCFVVRHVTAEAAGVSGDCLPPHRIPDGAPTHKGVTMQSGRDIWWHDAMASASTDCEPEWMDAEDPLFILYTSGSTGKPKGVLHTTGGYMVYAATTFKHVFDYHDHDMYWCTADIGWVTGHSYITYGPLANGATTIMFEGIPTYPDAGRFWDVVDKYKVTQFYTAPTAIRALMREGDQPVTSRSRASLKVLGSVGEPINPEAWLWYHRVVGDGRCPIVDTWWQTETGGILITPLPGATPTRPGSATRPFFGVKPVMLEPESGQPIDGPGAGVLCIAEPWPGQMRTVYGDHKRFKDTYFSNYKGYYFSGDGCRRDEDGYWWITGRVDDVINVSGHRMGTAEVESALVAHAKVAEAAVCGFPHEIKGQGIYAYVTLNAGEEYTDELKAELVKHVRAQIGAIAAPDVIHWAPGLPKTRSGKIMRRILRKIAEQRGTGPEGAGSKPCSAAELMEQIGDVTTLADPGVVESLIKER